MVYSKQLPWNLYLIKKVENIVIFPGLKMFNSDIVHMCFRVVKLHKSQFQTWSDKAVKDTVVHRTNLLCMDGRFKLHLQFLNTLFVTSICRYQNLNGKRRRKEKERKRKGRRKMRRRGRKKRRMRRREEKKMRRLMKVLQMMLLNTPLMNKEKMMVMMRRLW